MGKCILTRTLFVAPCSSAPTFFSASYSYSRSLRLIRVNVVSSFGRAQCASLLFRLPSSAFQVPGLFFHPCFPEWVCLFDRTLHSCSWCSRAALPSWVSCSAGGLQTLQLSVQPSLIESIPGPRGFSTCFPVISSMSSLNLPSGQRKPAPGTSSCSTILVPRHGTQGCPSNYSSASQRSDPNPWVLFFFPLSSHLITGRKIISFYSLPHPSWTSYFPCVYITSNFCYPLSASEFIQCKACNRFRWIKYIIHEWLGLCLMCFPSSLTKWRVSIKWCPFLSNFLLWLGLFTLLESRVSKYLGTM